MHFAVVDFTVVDWENVACPCGWNIIVKLVIQSFWIQWHSITLAGYKLCCSVVLNSNSPNQTCKSGNCHLLTIAQDVVKMDDQFLLKVQLANWWKGSVTLTFDCLLSEPFPCINLIHKKDWQDQSPAVDLH